MLPLTRIKTYGVLSVDCKLGFSQEAALTGGGVLNVENKPGFS